MCDLGVEYSWEFTDEIVYSDRLCTADDVYSDGDADPEDAELLPAQDNAENGIAAGSLQGPTSDLPQPGDPRKTG